MTLGSAVQVAAAHCPHKQTLDGKLSIWYWTE